MNLDMWNKAVICKLCWNLYKEKDASWIKWVHGFYIKGKDLKTMTILGQCSWMIKKIIEVRKHTRLEGGGSVPALSVRKMYLELMGEIPQMG